MFLKGVFFPQSHTPEFCIHISKMSTNYGTDIGISVLSVKWLHKYFKTVLTYTSYVVTWVAQIFTKAASDLAYWSPSGLSPRRGRVQSEPSPRGNCGGQGGNICTQNPVVTCQHYCAKFPHTLIYLFIYLFMYLYIFIYLSVLYAI